MDSLEVILKQQNDPENSRKKEWEKQKKISEIKVAEMMKQYRKKQTDGKPIKLPLYKIDKG
jgi:hypothetical protein